MQASDQLLAANLSFSDGLSILLQHFFIRHYNYYVYFPSARNFYDSQFLNLFFTFASIFLLTHSAAMLATLHLFLKQMVSYLPKLKLMTLVFLRFAIILVLFSLYFCWSTSLFLYSLKGSLTLLSLHIYLCHLDVLKDFLKELKYWMISIPFIFVYLLQLEVILSCSFSTLSNLLVEQINSEWLPF